jgi:hypothetical protein
MDKVKEKYNPDPIIIPGGNDEAKEESKNPGAAFGLVMGAYPLMLLIAIALGLAYLAYTSSETNSLSKPSESNETFHGK